MTVHKLPIDNETCAHCGGTLHRASFLATMACAYGETMDPFRVVELSNDNLDPDAVYFNGDKVRKIEIREV